MGYSLFARLGVFKRGLKMSEQHPLLPYVPRIVATWPESLPAPSFQEVHGSMLFADISGFTKLSERLAKQGKVGAEELVTVINSTFHQLLAVAYAEDGSLLKFGGDALLLFFSGDNHELRAARAGVSMRRTLREIGKISTTAGGVALKISIGAHSDLFHFYFVGQSHNDLVVTGPAATRTVLMEATAEGGDVLVSPETALALPERNRGPSKGDGILIRGTPPATSIAVRPEMLPTSVDIPNCIPRAIRHHLQSGGEGPAHRQVTVMFLHFDGTDELAETRGPAAVRDALHELVSVVQEAADKHEVSYIDSDIDANGGKIYLAGGAPSAHDNDEGRILLTARQIIDAGTQIPVRIGINRGHVFTGDIGPAYRRTYTYMGDAVNLAARVMSKASPGEVLATTEVADLSETAFELEPLEPFMVKGKSRPVQAFRIGQPVGRKAASHDATPLIGRERELEILVTRAREAKEQGVFIEELGEPGIGKSRLIVELTKLGELPIFSARCEPYETQTPYSAFKGILHEIANISVALEAPDKEAALRRIVEESAPDLVPWLPFIGIPFGLELPPTPQTSSLHADLRRQRLATSVTEFLKLLLPGPALLVFEDVHWMDDASDYLLQRITESVSETQWIVVAARRPEGKGFDVEGRDDIVRIEVGPLAEEATRQLVNEITKDSPLLPHEIDAVVERAAGHPMFVQQLVAWIASGRTEALPDSLEQAIAIRIDQLPPKDRTSLRRLSVLGMSFSKDLANAILPDQRGKNLWRRLGEFIEEDGTTLKFRNDVIREACYSALPYRTRQEVHRTAAEWLESHSDDTTREAATLSLHFFEAKIYDKVWKYAFEAGKHSQKVFAPVQAARLYERAVEASNKVPSIHPSERVEALTLLSDTRYIIGEYDRAEEAIKRARKLVESDPVEQARLIGRQLRIPYRSGRLSNSIRWITKGLKILEGLSDAEATTERASLLAWYGAIREDQGRSAEAIKWLQKAIDQAQHADDKPTLARAATLMDVALRSVGELGDLENSKLALRLYEELADPEGRARVLNNLGGFAYDLGRWDEAVDYYQRSRKDRLLTGDVAGATIATYNIAEILQDQGRFDEAEPLAQEAVRVWKARGDRNSAYAMLMLGRIAYQTGRFEEAGPMLKEAREIFEFAGASSQVSIIDSYIAEAAALKGDHAEASETIERLLGAVNNDQGARAQAPFLYRLKASLLEAQGDTDGARASLEESLKLCRARGFDLQTGLTLRALSRLEGAPREYEEEASRILSRLGVS